jgi:alpha-mannosidase
MKQGSSSARKFSRRQVLRAGAAVGVGSLFGDRVVTAQAQRRPAAGAKPLYYVDGYHGGIDGHMPPASLKNVMDGLEKYPGWKVSFEIEPYSWAAFEKSDPESIKRLGNFLADKTAAARVELVSGAYGQTYAWNISGESNIRQLVYGGREIAAVFPDVKVDTYAVQEPCWTSCLPQLLRSLGYKRAVLKNSTCWGGYYGPTIDADLIEWTGPDGTSIPAAPRYALEGLVGPATIESSQPGEGFLARCEKAGIENPAGTILQDMGWPGRPWRLGIAASIANSMKHVTWREYVATIASPATKKWEASQEDLRVGLAWGSTIVQRIAQNVRRCENLIIMAEKLASVAGVLKGMKYPMEELDLAWKDLMFCQHHDVWIVPYNRRRGGAWASEVEERIARVEEICGGVINSAVGVGGALMGTWSAAADSSVRVWNTSGFSRRDVVEIPLSGDGQRSISDSKGNVRASQIVMNGAGKSALLADVEVPATGYATVQVKTTEGKPSGAPVEGAASVRSEADGAVILQNELLTLKVDPTRGGRISSLVLRENNWEFVDGASHRSFHELRGYFAKEGQFLSSAEAPATISIEESGPVRGTVRIDGKIGPYAFVTRVSVTARSPRIDFSTTFDFPVDAPPFARPNRPQTFRIGEPWEPRKDVTRSDRRPMYDSSYKLQALFPAKLKSPVLDKNAPFAVERSKLKDTTFNSWGTLQHNVILNWVDLLESDSSAGLAVFSDHTTAYSLTPKEPLGLVCCYAGLGTWFDYALGRKPVLRYAVVPHAGNWEKAGLWRELERWSQPLVASAAGESKKEEGAFSFVEAVNTDVHITSLHEDKGQILLRLFNATAASIDASIRVPGTIKSTHLVELDGRLVNDLPLTPVDVAQKSFTVSMPRFAVRTVRLVRT